MEKIKKIQNGLFQSDKGYILNFYVRAVAFRRESDDKILVLDGYRSLHSIFVLEWPGIVHWSDGARVSEEEVEVLMQVALDVNSIAEGWGVANVRDPIPGR